MLDNTGLINSINPQTYTAAVTGTYYLAVHSGDNGIGTYKVSTSAIVDTTTPTISSIATSGPVITNGNGHLNAGKIVTLTVDWSEAVTVTGGAPKLLLNDGGMATYAGGSGTSALTFNYTVLAVSFSVIVPQPAPIPTSPHQSSSSPSANNLASAIIVCCGFTPRFVGIADASAITKPL